MTPKNNLLPCLARMAQLQNVAIDRFALQEAVESADPTTSAAKQLQHVAKHLHLNRAQVRTLRQPDPTLMPILIYSADGQWGVLRGLNAKQQWITEWRDEAANQWNEIAQQAITDTELLTLNLVQPYSATNSPVYKLIRGEVFSHKRLLVEAALGGVVVNMVALATSFYTMQVYDRVVPTGASQTLLVLTLGVCIAIVYEFFTKKIRSRLFERLIEQVDQRLSRSVFMRFLNVRLDQLPHSVGGLAAQMRGYETVRNFLTSVTSQLMIDAPFALIFIGIVWLIGGQLAFIPAAFFCVSAVIGWHYRGRVDALAGQANIASNLKTGLLVESIEGAETIKSGQSGWRMLSRWMGTADEARDYELQMRYLGEYSQFMVASCQQFSYILLIAAGALLVSRGELTLGGLIACSILSGRILAPVASIPNQLVQWAHVKAALRALDHLWSLQDDHHGQEHPVVLEHLKGSFRFEKVAAQYGENAALSVPGLHIAAGEKVGVLGPVGAGKTTLLRLLSGMYKPQAGRVLLDDVDLAHISKPVLAERIGFVQQEGRLFSGTLRENLTLGLLDPGDEAILNAGRLTGLFDAVIASHPKGLQREIYEGGTGLSGGQRQLVNLTRAFLRKPSIWLLDEPTASMDRKLELQVLQALRNALKSEHTLILVTHKPEMLRLVDRVIVIANTRIMLDGPREQVLEKLQAPKKLREKTA